jgi:hypothetical protein
MGLRNQIPFFLLERVHRIQVAQEVQVPQQKLLF